MDGTALVAWIKKVDAKDRVELCDKICDSLSSAVLDGSELGDVVGHLSEWLRSSNHKVVFKT